MRVVVTGASGFLGQSLCALLAARGAQVLAVAGPGGAPLSSPEWQALDLAEPGAAAALLARARPDAVVHLAALADIAPCRADPALALRLNSELPGEIATACAAAGAVLISVSTDQVFDGTRGGWREEDVARPLHVYGTSKLAGEAAVRAALPAALIVRPSLLTGPAPPGRRSASSALHAAWAAGLRPRLFIDERRSPLAVADAARALADLLDQELAGAGPGAQPAASRLLHLGGPQPLSRYELGRLEALAAGVDPDRIEPVTRVAAGLAHERPADLTLDSRRLVDRLGWAPRTLA